MPSINESTGDEILNSFYFDYLLEQVTSRISGFIPPDKTELLETAVKETISADVNVSPTALDFSIIRRYLVQSSLRSLQKQIAGRLKAAGFRTKLTHETSEGEVGELFGEFSLLDDYEADNQLKNVQKAQAFLDNVKPTSVDFVPPPIIKAFGAMDKSGFAETAIEIEPLYSGIPELINGGIFVERGIELIHNRSASSSKSAARSLPSSITAEEIDLLIDALPLNILLGEEYEFASTANVIEYTIPYIGPMLGVTPAPLKYVQLWEPNNIEFPNYIINLTDSSEFK